jgi:hypothetical protein
LSASSCETIASLATDVLQAGRCFALVYQWPATGSNARALKLATQPSASTAAGALT